MLLCINISWRCGTINSLQSILRCRLCLFSFSQLLLRIRQLILNRLIIRVIRFNLRQFGNIAIDTIDILLNRLQVSINRVLGVCLRVSQVCSCLFVSRLLISLRVLQILSCLFSVCLTSINRCLDISQRRCVIGIVLLRFSIGQLCLGIRQLLLGIFQRLLNHRITWIISCCLLQVIHNCLDIVDIRCDVSDVLIQCLISCILGFSQVTVRLFLGVCHILVSCILRT